MVPLQFFGQNLHFAVSLLAALVFFAVFWLYFDAWLGEEKKRTKDTLKWLGFLLVCVSFIFHATVIEETGLGHSVFGQAAETISNILRLVGYVVIIIGQLTDPIQLKPKTKSLEEEMSKKPTATKVSAVGGTSSFGSLFVLPLGALFIAGLYWRRATTGLERHLRPVAIAFTALFLFELTSLASIWENTTNPNIYNIVKPFGPIWIMSHLLLLAGVLVLGRWVWRYLTERFLSQLFMLFTSAVLIIFLLTTISFTYLLIRNVQNDTLDNLQTATNVLNYALDGKKAQTAANAELMAQNSAVTAAIIAKDHKALAALTGDFLQTKKQSTLDFTDSSGQVLLRAEDPSHWGDSISSDTSVRRALIGQEISSVTSKQGVLAPAIYIKTTTPIKFGGNIVGTVSVSLLADNALTDGIKNATGLDSSIYSGNTLSATTFTAPDGKSRLTGITVTNKKVTKKVLGQAQTFKGETSILNRPYMAVYVPLKDADNTVVGMLFVGQPQTSLLQTAGHSIELTFVVAALLMVASIVPAYFMARYISYQLK